MNSVKPSIDLIADGLSQTTTLAGPTIARIRRELSSYRFVTDQALADSVERNIALACHTLKTRRVPATSNIWEADQATQERLDSGVPIEDIMAAFRVSITEIEQWTAHYAKEVQLPTTDVVELTSLLWKLSDRFSARAASVYRSSGVQRAVASEAVKNAWISRLLKGDMPPEDLAEGSKRYDLDLTRTYRAFSAMPAALSQKTYSDFARQAASAKLYTFFDDRVIGIATQELAADNWLIAVGPARPLQQIAYSYEIAVLVFAAAELRHASGTHCLSGLTWRVAIPQLPALSQHLREKYLRPLGSVGNLRGEIIDSLRSYLQHDRRIALAAEAMHIHPNTLRYRLDKFEEITGSSLAETDTLIELSWLLYEQESL